MTRDPDPDLFAQVKRDLARSRHLGGELLANLVVIAVLLLTVAVIWQVGASR